jgi:glycosyltransferase involved in cell wall biosynthesis
MDKYIKVSHIIIDLNVGGAEVMLSRLVSTISKDKFESEVISLTSEGDLAHVIRSAGVPIRTLKMDRSLLGFIGFFKLIHWLRKSKPDIVHTWMYHADLLGGVAARLAGSIPVIWSIRHSDFTSQSKMRTRLVRRFLGRISPWLPAHIISNSHEAIEVHHHLGYPREKVVVIPNGFDLAVWRSDPDARASVRRELNLDDDVLIIGYVARFHPQKDHTTFIKAAGLVAENYPSVHFVLCGYNVDWDNKKLVAMINATKHSDRFHLLGRREDIPRLTASFDIASLSSAFGEAFPTIVGEAMACEVPCVVTDVGDAAQIVQGLGTIIPPMDVQALTVAWENLIKLGFAERDRLGKASRERIKERYDLNYVVSRYEDLYSQIMTD